MSDLDNQTAADAKDMALRPDLTIWNFYKYLNVVSVSVLTLTPILAIYGAFTTKLTMATAIWSVLYYLFTGLGITAGYHRCFSHRAFIASRPLKYFLTLAGAGAFEGSARWWCRGHRAHHRYTDTNQDPYAVHNGLFHAHFGWMMFKPLQKPGVADISDLLKDDIIMWQHKNYVTLATFMAFVFPTLVAGLGWGDWRGGYFYAGVMRLVFLHHSTFCVNSLAHYLGDTPFDDKHSPRDHFITALVTLGEGYHNFHHEFPQDYRNAIKWYQYDPTKIFIWTCSKLGLAYNLKEFPENEVRKGFVQMEMKKLEQLKSGIQWASKVEELPIMTFEEFQQASKSRPLILVHGIVHDVGDFVEDHPGGIALIKSGIGKDMTTAFHGGVYDHSNAAHNLLSMMRVAVVSGGMEVEALKTGKFRGKMD